VGEFLLVPAYPGSPGHKAVVKRLCVCVCALAEVVGCERTLHGTSQSGPNQPLAHVQRHVVVFRVAQL